MASVTRILLVSSLCFALCLAQGGVNFPGSGGDRNRVSALGSGGGSVGSVGTSNRGSVSSSSGSKNKNNNNNKKKDNVGQKASARLEPEDCECQCRTLSFQSGGVNYGNCNTEYRGAVWCYVRNAECSTCEDITPSQRFGGTYWSYHACTTPRRRRCYRSLGLRPPRLAFNNICNLFNIFPRSTATDNIGLRGAAPGDNP